MKFADWDRAIVVTLVVERRCASGCLKRIWSPFQNGFSNKLGITIMRPPPLISVSAVDRDYSGFGLSLTC